MLAKIASCAIIGLEGAIVEVEIDTAPGLPTFTMVGLPDTAVQESRDRVRTAIKNSGCRFPGNRVTINLAPADLRKEGPSFDLAIAVALLRGSEQVLDCSDALFVGELSLDAGLRHVPASCPSPASPGSRVSRRSTFPGRGRFGSGPDRGHRRHPRRQSAVAGQPPQQHDPHSTVSPPSDGSG